MAKDPKDQNEFSPEETERRVEATLRAALKTPPKPKKRERGSPEAQSRHRPKET